MYDEKKKRRRRGEGKERGERKGLTEYYRRIDMWIPHLKIHFYCYFLKRYRQEKQR